MTRSSRGRLVAVLTLTLLVASGVLARGYWQSRPRDAPLPETPFSLGADQVADPALAPTGTGRQPDRLLIPSLEVAAPLGVAGVDDDLLDLPDDIDRAVLWDGSAPIGSDHGSLLVAGHLDNADQQHGVLYRLSTIKPGAAIYLVHEHRVTSWKVTGLSATRKTALPTALWTGPAGPRRLYVITCGGPIVGGHYEDNVVVTAVPVSSARPEGFEPPTF